MKITKNKHLIINLFGGPGTGKSTTAADLFGLLKKEKHNFKNNNNQIHAKNIGVELVREFAKEVIYEQAENQLDNQFYISAIQQKRIVDVIKYFEKNNTNSIIITDSPIILGVVYNKTDNSFLNNAIIHEFLSPNGYSVKNINVFLNRNAVDTFEDLGRVQDKNSSKKLDNDIFDLLEQLNIDFNIEEASENVAEIIYEKYIKPEI